MEWDGPKNRNSITLRTFFNLLQQPFTEHLLLARHYPGKSGHAKLVSETIFFRAIQLLKWIQWSSSAS